MERELGAAPLEKGTALPRNPHPPVPKFTKVIHSCGAWEVLFCRWVFGTWSCEDITHITYITNVRKVGLWNSFYRPHFHRDPTEAQIPEIFAKATVLVI